MNELIIDNPYLHGIGLLLIVELVLWILIVWYRKPSASCIIDIFYPNAVGRRGLQVKKWYDIVSAILVLWIFSAVIIKAIVMWLNRS